jgi:hypothetical protein
MEQDTQKVLQEQIAKLPPEVQDAVISPTLREKITEVGKKYALHIDQIGKLEDETVLVMIGLANPTDFVENLTAHVSLEKSVADKVAADVSDQIFLPIREAMKKFMDEEDKGKQGPSVVMPSAVNAATTAPLAGQARATSAPVPPTPVPKPPAPPSAALAGQAASAPAVKPVEIHAADLMLSEPTISLPPKPPAPPVPVAPVVPPPPTPAAKVETPKPPPYKADPYREPPE